MSAAQAVGASEARLRLEGVAKRWPRQPAPLFAGLDLEVEAGALAVVTGRNGVGKTTLLRIIAGLIHPDAGTVWLDGLAPRGSRREYQRRIGFLSAASAGLYARLTVGQHLQYWGRLSLLSDRDLRSRVIETCATFELGEIVSRRADRLSMGQRQRLRLALAFLHRPSVLVLDEPTNSLDDAGIELLRTEAAGFMAEGGCIVYSVPAGQELHGLPADESYILENGELRRT